jgi:ribosomal protein L24
MEGPNPVNPLNTKVLAAIDSADKIVDTLSFKKKTDKEKTDSIAKKVLNIAGKIYNSNLDMYKNSTKQYIAVKYKIKTNQTMRENLLHLFNKYIVDFSNRFQETQKGQNVAPPKRQNVATQKGQTVAPQQLDLYNFM